jgi:hypothetical protein
MKDERLVSAFIAHPSSFGMAEGYGVEPYTVINRRSFQDCLTHSTVGPSLKLAGTLGFEPRISILETDGFSS